MGKKTAAPPPSPAKISLAIQRDGIQPFACARASRFHLHLTLDIAASQALEPTDTVVLTGLPSLTTRLPWKLLKLPSWVPVILAPT